MGTKKSGINYVDYSLGFWKGCTKVSRGCMHCYAEREMTRYKMNFNFVERTSAGTWKKHESFVSGSRVMVCPWSDFFHRKADAWRADAWEVIRLRKDLTWVIVTKRPHRIPICLPEDWGNGYPNVWLLATAENQLEAIYRIAELLKTPAAIRGVSVEPMVGPVSLKFGNLTHPRQVIDKLDWVICGGESGPEATPINPEWVRDLRNECVDSKIPFFFKQWGPRGAGNVLDGMRWEQLPR